MELHELRIGDRRASERRQAQALAAHLGGRGGDGVEAADAAGRQDHGGRADLDQGAVDLRQHADDPTCRVLQKPAGAGVLADLDRRRGADRGDHGGHDRRPGPVAADPGDPGLGMGRLEAQDEAVVGLTVERRAEGGQIADGPRAFGGQQRDSLGIAQSRAGGDRVGGVKGRAVLA